MRRISPRTFWKDFCLYNIFMITIGAVISLIPYFNNGDDYTARGIFIAWTIIPNVFYLLFSLFNIRIDNKIRDNDPIKMKYIYLSLITAIIIIIFSLMFFYEENSSGGGCPGREVWKCYSEGNTTTCNWECRY